jgi:hypothetical protein
MGALDLATARTGVIGGTVSYELVEARGETRLTMRANSQSLSFGFFLISAYLRQRWRSQLIEDFGNLKRLLYAE